MLQARIDRIRALLIRVERYNTIVVTDSLREDALNDMKDNVKSFTDDIKDELDQIKSEVDNW